MPVAGCWWIKMSIPLVGAKGWCMWCHSSTKWDDRKVSRKFERKGKLSSRPLLSATPKEKTDHCFCSPLSFTVFYTRSGEIRTFFPHSWLWVSMGDFDFGIFFSPKTSVAKCGTWPTEILWNHVSITEMELFSPFLFHLNAGYYLSTHSVTCHISEYKVSPLHFLKGLHFSLLLT